MTSPVCVRVHVCVRVGLNPCNVTSAHPNTTAATSSLLDLRGLSTDSSNDLMLMMGDAPPLQPQLAPTSQAGEQNELCAFGSLSHVSGKQAGCPLREF